VQAERDAERRALERETQREDLERARDEARLADFASEKQHASAKRGVVEAEVLSRQCSSEGVPLDAADARRLYLVRWELREKVDISQSVLSVAECDRVVALAEAWAQNNGGWTTDRHGAYPTTDIAVRDLEEEESRAYIEGLVMDRVIGGAQVAARCFLPEHFWCRDLFVVRYEAGRQAALKKHTDGSTLSFNILLNPRDEFDGGGTYFTHLDTAVGGKQGDLVIHDGNFEHAGTAITRGTRLLLVGFLETADQRAQFGQHAGRRQ